MRGDTEGSREMEGGIERKRKGERGRRRKEAG